MNSEKLRLGVVGALFTCAGFFIGFVTSHMSDSSQSQAPEPQAQYTPQEVALQPSENICYWPVKGNVESPADLLALLPGLFPASEVYRRLRAEEVSYDGYEILVPCLNAESMLMQNIAEPFTQYAPKGDSRSQHSALFFRSYMCSECERFLDELKRLQGSEPSKPLVGLFQVFVPRYRDWKSVLLDRSMQCALAQGASDEQRDWIVGRISKLTRFGSSFEDIDSTEYATYRKLLMDAFRVSTLQDYAEICVPEEDVFKPLFKEVFDAAPLPLQKFFSESRHAYLFSDSALFLANEKFAANLMAVLEE
jgi:hypothetical protein